MNQTSHVCSPPLLQGGPSSITSGKLKKQVAARISAPQKHHLLPRAARGYYSSSPESKGAWIPVPLWDKGSNGALQSWHHTHVQVLVMWEERQLSGSRSPKTLVNAMYLVKPVEN